MLILCLEETHRRDFQEVKADVSTLADRVTTGESSRRWDYVCWKLERARDQHRDTAIAPQLHLEDVKDQSHCNNLRLRGIPESVEVENLGQAVQGLFRAVLEEPLGVVEVDRAHRTLGPKSADPERPRDVV